MIGGIKYVVKRHFEHLGHFRASSSSSKPGRTNATTGVMRKPVRTTWSGRIADHRDEGLVDADFLARLAQRRRPAGRHRRLDAAARKTDLPGVVPQVRGTLRQQSALRAIDRSAPAPPREWPAAASAAGRLRLASAQPGHPPLLERGSRRTAARRARSRTASPSPDASGTACGWFLPQPSTVQPPARRRP